MYARTRHTGQPQLVRVSRTIARQVMNENVAILGVDVRASGHCGKWRAWRFPRFVRCSAFRLRFSKRVIDALRR